MDWNIPNRTGRQTSPTHSEAEPLLYSFEDSFAPFLTNLETLGDPVFGASTPFGHSEYGLRIAGYGLRDRDIEIKLAEVRERRPFPSLSDSFNPFNSIQW